MELNNRFFSFFRAAARGMEAQRITMATASENIANAGTTRMVDGGPYAVKRVVSTAAEGTGRSFGSELGRQGNRLVQSDAQHMGGSTMARKTGAGEVGPDTEVLSEMRLRAEFDPTHPHADAAGYVQYPDINVVEEMARLISANRIYEANLTTVQAAKEMIRRTLEI
jgi:flagellar basal-body rod protein FlgC